MVGAAQTRESLTMNLMSGVDALKHVREQMLDTFSSYWATSILIKLYNNEMFR